MELLGKISCFSLVLLHCVIKFRLDGKILQNNPQVGIAIIKRKILFQENNLLLISSNLPLCFQSLVGILVSQSLQLFEMELLHGLAELAGKYCNFDPTSPMKGVKSQIGNEGLMNSIKSTMSSNSSRFQLPNQRLKADNSSKGNNL